MSRCCSRRGASAAVLGVCVALWGRGATAGEPSPVLDLVYEAPPECPSRAELEEELRARVPASWLTRSDARRFEVHIVREEEGRYAGRLDVRGASREPNVREIRAATCRAVSTSIAVFLALALDPGAVEGGHEEGGGEEQPTAAPPRAPRPRERTLPRPGPPAPSVSWTWSSGMHARHLRAPEPGWGGRIHAELVRRSASAAVAPAARLSYGWSDFSVPAPYAGEASFRLRSARLEACARIALPSAFAVSPCGALDIGTLSGAAPELRGARKETTGWSAGGAVLRASWSMTTWLAVELDATLLAPFERTSFVLEEPLRTVYRAPRVLFEGGAGACVSVRFH